MNNTKTINRHNNLKQSQFIDYICSIFFEIIRTNIKM